VSAARRRFFWGQTVAQALARAARYHGAAPERLAFQVRGKRHGFVKHPRAVLIEVDPAAPLLAEGAPAAVAASPAAPPPPERAPRHRRAASPGPEEESWDAPDAESELAATEAMHRLLALAGLGLTVACARTPERLELTLGGADESALAAAGVPLLDAFEALLPRAVVALSGRRVRCRIDGAGLRAARESELRALARDAAGRARAEGEAVLPPLAAAERRIVHLELQEEPDLGTESVGRGQLKRVRVYASPDAAGGGGTAPSR